MDRYRIDKIETHLMGFHDVPVDFSDEDIETARRSLVGELTKLEDQIMGASFVERAGLWVPPTTQAAEPSTSPAATTSTATVPSFEDMGRMMADLDRKMRETDPLYDYRNECELIASPFLTNEGEVVVIDRSHASNYSSDGRFSEWPKPKRWLIIAAETVDAEGKTTNAVVILRRQLRERGESVSDADLLASIAYMAHQQATKERFARRLGFSGFAEGIAFREW
jgi:hypothetical protein